MHEFTKRRRHMIPARAFAAALTSAAFAIAITICFASAASASDRNHDQIPDRWETAHGLSLQVKQAKKDPDRDGLKNKLEYLGRTDPKAADSDADGVSDTAELDAYNDEFDVYPSIISGWDAASGELTLSVFARLNDGEFITDSWTVQVTDASQIRCESPATPITYLDFHWDAQPDCSLAELSPGRWVHALISVNGGPLDEVVRLLAINRSNG